MAKIVDIENTPETNQSATKIQANFRSKKARQEIDEMQNAAVKIQANYRGNKERKSNPKITSFRKTKGTYDPNKGLMALPIGGRTFHVEHDDNTVFFDLCLEQRHVSEEDEMNFSLEQALRQMEVTEEMGVKVVLKTVKRLEERKLQAQGSDFDSEGVGHLWGVNMPANSLPLEGGDAFDAHHKDSHNTHQRLEAIARGAKIRAFLCGLAVGMCCATGELVSAHLFQTDGTTFDELWDEKFWNCVKFWCLNGFVIMTTAILEMIWMFYDSLNCIGYQCHELGIHLHPVHRENLWLTLNIASIGLELGDPSDAAFGVDPLGYSRKSTIIIKALLYKAKRGVSNFIAKVFLKRVLSRATLRGGSNVNFLAPWISAPIFGFWNAFAAHGIQSHGKVMLISCILAARFVDSLLSEKNISDDGKELILQAIACSVVSDERTRPSNEVLLRRTYETFLLHRHLYPSLEDMPDHFEKSKWVHNPEAVSHGDLHEFVEALQKAHEEERHMALEMFFAAMCFDSQITRRDLHMTYYVLKQLEWSEEKIGHVEHYMDFIVREINQKDLMNVDELNLDGLFQDDVEFNVPERPLFRNLLLDTDWKPKTRRKPPPPQIVNDIEKPENFLIPDQDDKSMFDKTII